jgi:raffinose/stachyose/melibiose transport system substrate-binding protein
MSRHFGRIFSGLAILGLMLAGCAAPQAGTTSTTESTEASAEKVQVTMWADADANADCFVDVLGKGFNEQSETIELVIERKANMIDAVRPALAGGAGPDIVPTHGPAFVAEFALAGQVLPLDDLAKDFKWDEMFVPWALNLGRVEGTLYSLPQELETIILWYNKTLFEEHGWTPPTTIDELIALSDQIQAEGIIPLGGQGGECQACNEWYFTEFVNKIAGPEKVYQALKGEIPWTDPDFVTSIHTLNDMMQKGYWMGSVENFLATDFATFQAAFGAGDAAMNMEGTWFYNSVDQFFGPSTEHGNEWDWVPFPSQSGDAIYNIGIGGTQSINQASEHPREAAEVLTYLFSPDVQSALFSQCQNAVAPIRIDSSQFTGVDERMSAVFADFAKASDEGRYGYTTWTFFPPKTDQYIFEELEKVWVGDLTPEDYMAGIDAQFRQEAEAGETLPIPDRTE